MNKKSKSSLSNLTHKIPTIWKFMFSALIIGLISVEAIFYLYKQITTVAELDLSQKIEQVNAIHQLLIQLSIGLVLIILLIFIALLMDINRLVYKINLIIKESLAERKLEDHFTNLHNAKNFDELRKNINSVLSLFKSFDMMKANRIALETSSIKSIMNNISEGVLLINKEKVVTHINHRGEQMLRLIPGEIIGTAISRKISHETFLAKLDDAIQNNQIITDQHIQIKENHPLSLNIFPIKNKFGEVIRAMVIIHPHNGNNWAPSSPEPNNTETIGPSPTAQKRSTSPTRKSTVKKASSESKTKKSASTSKSTNKSKKSSNKNTESNNTTTT